MSANKEPKGFTIPLNGQVIKSDDPAAIGNNFQDLINMEYTDSHPRAIQGMTRVNTTAVTYPLFRSLFHFKKHTPSETHLLAQVFDNDSSPGGSYVYENSNSIPTGGEFTSVLHTDATGSEIGSFANAPDGAVLYCNGKETMIYGGNESRVAAFINKSINNDFEHDYTTEVQSSSSDADSVATMHRYNETIDANTKLLCHFENNATDETAGHTLSPYQVSYDASTKKIGTYAAQFNGVSSYIGIADHDDFNFNHPNDNFTIEFWVNFDVTTNNPQTLYKQYVDDDNYFAIYAVNAGTDKVEITVVARSGGETKLSMIGSSQPITKGQWAHVALTEANNNFRLFVDGKLASYVNTENRIGTYATSVFIGYPAFYFHYHFKGYLDELRISNTCRYTTDFIPRTMAYAVQKVTVIYVGSTRPIKGIKPYIGTANTTAATLNNAEYWSDTGWKQGTNIVDGTSTGGKTLAQTGWVNFDGMLTDAHTTIISNRYLYWSRLTFLEVDETTTISYVTVDTSFQSLKDIWDGVLRLITSFKQYKVTSGKGTFYDYTVNVATDTYSSTDAATYGKGGATTGTDYLLFGFDERMCGLFISYAEEYVNSEPDTIMTLEYWDGSQWVTVSGLTDGTSSEGISAARTGYVSWTPPESYQEFRKSYGSGSDFYYYKVSYSKTLDTHVADTGIRIPYVGGIPVQKKIPGYRFSFMDASRSYLCNDYEGRKNEILALKAETNCVANGDDSIKIQFGDDSPIVAGGSLYSQLGSNIYDIKVICKENEVWMLTGKSPKDFEKKKIYSNDGCIAHHTFATGVVNIAGSFRPVAIWMGANGIYLYDGSTVVPIHRDINIFFDKSHSSCMSAAYSYAATGYINPVKNWYHFIFHTGTTLASGILERKEWVYDIGRNKWFEIQRGTRYLSAIAKVTDTTGNVYMYGATDEGYVYRLDYGTLWHDEDMEFTLHTADQMLAQDVETLIKELQVKCVAKNEGTNAVTITHYGDANEQGFEIQFKPRKQGHRLTSEVLGVNLGNNVYHSFKLQATTNGDSYAFEPLSINGRFIPIREHGR